MRQVIGPLEMDLFASRLTHQLPRFAAGDRIPWHIPQMQSPRIGVSF